MSCIGHCCEALFSVSAHHVCELRPTLWTVLTLIFILYPALAVAIVTSTCTDHINIWHKPASVCDKPGPILLSRALTTDPFRGITITAAFACALFYGYSPSISPVRIPLVGVLCMIGFAFIVSMFETNAHFYIINLTSGAALLFTCPIWHDFHEAWKSMQDNTAEAWDQFLEDSRHRCCIESKQQTAWWVLWTLMTVLGGVTGALLYTNDDVRSWVYVTAYAFFSLLFWSFSWTIREAEYEEQGAPEPTTSRHVSIQF